MTFDLNKEYDALIEKHKTFFDRMCENGYCVFAEVGCSCEKKQTQADAFFNKLPADAKIAVCGIGYYTYSLVNALSPYNRKRIMYYTCSDEIKNGEEFKGREVISLTAIKDKEVDFIILSTREYRAEMRNNLIKAGFPDEKLLNIYTPLEELSNSANLPQSKETQCRGYQCISTAKVNHIIMSSLYEYFENSKYILQKHKQIEASYSMIVGFITARDIVNTKRLAHLYIESKYPLHELLGAYTEDLDNLMSQAHEHIQARSHAATIIYLFDANEYVNFAYMPNLDKLCRESLMFDRAFTQYAYSTSTLQLVFTGKDLVDEKAFEVTTFTEDNSPLLQAIKAYDYKLHVIRSDYRITMFTESETVVIHKTLKTASCEFFEMLAVLSGKDEKQVIFMHTFETHMPYYSPYNYHYRLFRTKPYSVMDDSLSVLTPIVRSLTYLDEQFDYYYSFLPATAVKIVMSDHGDNYMQNNKRFMSGGLYEYVNQFYQGTRCTLFIIAPHIKPGVIRGLFCLKDFVKLLGFVWNQCEISSVLCSYVKFQSLPLYDEEKIKKCAPFLPLPMRGTIDSDGFYIMRYDGKESYRTNDNIDRIDDPAYLETIDRMRTLCGDWAYDIFEHSKMIHAKKAYREMGLI